MIKRIYAIDVLRGISLFLMIVANTQFGKDVFALFEHAEWFGLNFFDFVFPMFLTIVGISAYFSLSRWNFKLTKNSVFKVLKRTILLIAVAYLLSIINKIIVNLADGKTLAEAVAIFENFRFTGVLWRIAICYCIASFIVMLVPNRKWIVGTIIVLLVGYWVILVVFNGLEHSSENIIGKIDVLLFGDSHIYHDKLSDGTSISFDPEGLLSSLPCVAQVLLGFLASSILKQKTKSQTKTIANLFVMGFGLMVAGFVCSLFLDFNKKIWTPSFCLMTAGVTISLLALLMYVLDYKGYTKWAKFFEVYGTNTLFGFCIYGIINNLLILAGFTKAFYGFVVGLISIGEIASVCYSLIIVLIVWLILYALKRKNIIIKL